MTRNASNVGTLEIDMSRSVNAAISLVVVLILGCVIGFAQGALFPVVAAVLDYFISGPVAFFLTVMMFAWVIYVNVRHRWRRTR